MAEVILPISSDEVSKAMLDGLMERIRDALRAKILERIEPDIEAALDAAVESFKIAVQGQRDHFHMQDVIRILVERR